MKIISTIIMQFKYTNKKIIFSLIISLALLNGTAQEKHIKNIKKLTFGGDNAEAYFSPNGQMLTMQVSNPKAGIPCDQIYLYDLIGLIFICQLLLPAIWHII